MFEWERSFRPYSIVLDLGMSLFVSGYGSMVLLHGIIKSGQKTPKEDLELSKKRRDEVFVEAKR